MTVKIVVDSTTDTLPEIGQRLFQVPLSIHFGEEEYLDGITIDQKTFYEKLIESDILPVTSQAPPAAFFPPLQQALAAAESVIIITLSAQLSGTYQSACIAAASFPGRVWVVDSQSVSIGTGILAELALQLAEQGLGAAEIVSRLEEAKQRIHVIALLDTLEYLRRGGRISAGAAWAGNLLAIKPVVHLKDGLVQLLGKARGSRQGNNLLAKEIEAAGGVDFSQPLLLGYTGLSDSLLHKYIEDSAALWQGHTASLRYTMIGSIVGTHCGPGAIAAAFFRPSNR